jgi:hypothetical protein
VPRRAYFLLRRGSSSTTASFEVTKRRQAAQDIGG